MKPEKLRVGDVVDGYRVIAVEVFGPLPRAVIVDGPNVGIEVYLTSPYRRPSP